MLLQVAIIFSSMAWILGTYMLRARPQSCCVSRYEEGATVNVDTLSESQIIFADNFAVVNQHSCE